MTRRYVNYKIINGFKVISQWYDKNNNLRFTIICKVCGREFDRSFSCLNKYKMKSCGCDRESQFKPLPDYINGFKIIECLGPAPKGKDRRAKVECKECGLVFESAVTKLRYNKSCGCVTQGIVVSRYHKSHPRLMHIFSGMKMRCCNKKHPSYKNYGGRGITICDEWLSDANKFCEWSLSNGYEESLTIDRIDNDKGYSPDNCRWVTPALNARNTRVVKMSMPVARKIRGENMKPKDIAKKYGVKIGMVYDIRLGRSWREEPKEAN